MMEVRPPADEAQTSLNDNEAVDLSTHAMYDLPSSGRYCILGFLALLIFIDGELRYP